MSSRIAIMCLCVSALLCTAGCNKASDTSQSGETSVGAAQKAPQPALAWAPETALDWITFQVPEGGAWSYGFGMAWHGRVDSPGAVFAVRSDTEIKRIIENAKASEKGEATVAGAQATLYEGIDPSWGTTRIWVLKDKHPKTGVEVAIVVAGSKQADLQQELDKIVGSIKFGLVEAE
jgi:hypothetical protein